MTAADSVIGGRRHVVREQRVTKVAPGAVSVRDHYVTTGWADPVRALSGTLDPVQLSTAETLFRLWHRVTKAGGRTIGAYDVASTGGGSAEPEMSEDDAKAHARLTRALRATGRAGITLINAVCYGIVFRTLEHERELRAALDVARPHLIVDEADEIMSDALDDLAGQDRILEGSDVPVTIGQSLRGMVRAMRARGLAPYVVLGRPYYVLRMGTAAVRERAQAELGVPIRVYDGKVASLRGAWIVPADLGGEG